MLKPISPDAVRTAEQLRARFNKRPASLLVSEGDKETQSGTLAIDLSRALASSESTRAIVLDFGVKNQAVEELLHDSAPEQREGDGYLEYETQLDDDVCYIRFEMEEKEGNFPTTVWDKIQESGETYQWVIVRGQPLHLENSYPIFSRVDRTIAVFAKDRSRLSSVQDLERKHRSVTHKDLSVLLISD